MGLYELRNILFLPPFGMTEMTASLHKGGVDIFQLKEFQGTGVKSLKILYHSAGGPSLPGVLLFFNLFTAVSNSFFCDL